MSLTVLIMPVPVEADTSNISESDITYQVEGGNIYFDKTTATITGCDQTVTVADIPAKISDVDVKSIGNRAFDSCTNLTSVIIPNGIVSIGEEAFDHCEKLTNIEIPQSVIEIGTSAFRSCYLMDEIVVDSNNEKYLSENGVLFNKDKSELIQYPDAKSEINYVIPEGVTNIEPYAFDDCKKLTEITIPNTVVIIGRGAFAACFGLTSVNIPDSVTSIGAYAFDACNHMTSIEISNSITEIPSNMLSQCPIKELNIPEGVTTIRSGAFEYCQSLVTVTIPESVTTIEFSAFDNCTCLEKIIIPKTVTEIGNGTFKGCNRLYIYGEVGSYAETYAAENGIMFNVLSEPSGIIEYTDGVIGGTLYFDTSTGTITDCTMQVTEVIIPEKINDVTVIAIGKDAFSSCRLLESVYVPETVKSIGESAFSGCFSLTTVNIPNGIEEIKSSTFSTCTSLETIDIPASVTDLSGSAFSNCDSLTAINVDSANEAFTSHNGVVFDKAGEWLYIYPAKKAGSEYSIPDGVKFILGGAFKNAILLEKVTMPEGLQSIGKSGFMGCTALKNVVLPEGLTRINEDTFRNCTSLESINIPESVTTISNRVFYDCKALQTIDIHKNISAIRNDAFYRCNSLQSINIDSNNAVFSSESGVLFNKDKDLLITYPAGKQDVKYVIPNTVTTIGQYAFGYAEKLEIIDIPDTVTTIEGSAFYGCKLFDNVVIPDSVTLMDDSVFGSCTSLKNIKISKKITNIGQSTFYNCKALTGLTLPDNITSIENEVFSYCTNLKWVVVPESVKTIGNRVFESNTVIYGTPGSYAETYASANGLTFKDISEGLPTDPTEPTDPDPVDPPAVEKQEQTIDVKDTFNKTYGDAAFNLNATASGQAALTYKSNNTDVAEVSTDGTVTIKSSGVATITVTAAETEDYKSASTEVTINVAKASQPSYTGETTYNKTYGCASFTINVPAKTSVTFASSNSGIVAVEKISSASAKVTVKSSGAATITATAAESGNYKRKTYKITVNVAKASQKINVKQTSYTKTYGCASFPLGATAKTGLTYKSSNINVATVTPEGAVSIKAGGTATITITAAETDKYKRATKTVAITANKASQSITCSSSFSKTFGYNYYFYLGAKSKTNRTYKSSSTRIATVSSSGKVVMKNPGKVTITITAASSDKYKSATKKVYFTSTLKRPGLTARAYSGRKIKLTWTKVPGAHGYRVYIYDRAKKKYVYRLTRSASVKSVTHSGLRAGRTYYYKVRAYRVVSGKRVYSPYSYSRKATARR